MAYEYDPAKEAGNPNYVEYLNGIKATPPAAPGPGGTSTNTENNEKGIQEAGLMEVIARHQRAQLGSDHDSQRQGIYRTNSAGDQD